MKLIPERFRHSNLFITMSLITVMIIIIVSITITWTTIRMSEQFFFDKFSITNAKVMNQVKESYEKYHYSVVLATNSIQQSIAIKDILTEKRETNAVQFQSIYQMSQLIKRVEPNMAAYEVGIIVVGANGLSYATNDRTFWPITDTELKESSLAEKTAENPNRLIYQYDKRLNDDESGSYIVASRGLVNRSGYTYGAAYISIRENEFRKFYSSYTSPGNDVFLVDKEGVIVSSSLSEKVGSTSKELKEYASELGNSDHDDYLIGEFMGKEQIMMMEYVPAFDMYMFNIIDKHTAFGDLIDKKKIMLISLSIVIAALFIVLLVSRRLTNSLSSLVKQIESASDYDFDEYVAVSGTYETRKIGIAFNSMLDELHEYVDQLVLSQKQRRNAELAALQQQINPHFLYNTLASIKFIASKGNIAETEAMINSLISLLQNTIGDVNETITVDQEINNLRNYVLINQKRYGDSVKVNYFVAPNCHDILIPKLILQPFMENSFFHGFIHKPQGYIHVLVWHEGDCLICEIVDNGDGMVIADEHLPQTKRKQQFSGIGIRNVHERIQLIYGESYGVEISSEVGEGTKVRITLPVQRK
ncbi:MULTISPECIES: sensor histidine kinase [unclassified Niallia]|uniref:cache domain-containing sensor histidine kinase n=1 Tax=unclassified Niallia TaxID=2837522 RepID=UPI001EDB6EE4|nr:MULTISPECIES: sensor histidine kinase [unclassified Niallia]MDL0435861.1 sensor histidine kinase [Niallia sp. SS-2023]UPO86204.1 sensor histidine kinase [Niallia sp. Man26]